MCEIPNNWKTSTDIKFKYQNFQKSEYKQNELYNMLKCDYNKSNNN